MTGAGEDGPHSAPRLCDTYYSDGRHGLSTGNWEFSWVVARSNCVACVYCAGVSGSCVIGAVLTIIPFVVFGGGTVVDGIRSDEPVVPRVMGFP